MRRTISFGSVSDIISGHQYAGDGCCLLYTSHDFKTPNEAYAADSLPGTGFEDYKNMVDFQASYKPNANNTANLNSVDYTTSLEGGIAIERVACIKPVSYTHLDVYKRQVQRAGRYY